MPRRMPLLLLAVPLVGAGCGGEDHSFPPYGEPPEGTPAYIAYEAGLTRYLGEVEPAEEEAYPDDVTTFTFDPADGPVCMRGDPFRASIRDAESDDLLIFLQGGGACWSDFCLAITGAPPNIPNGDLLRTTADNPLHDWNVLYVPYCDGSLHSGDNAIDEDGDGTADRIHHGLQNMSAALTMAFERLPHPRRVVLAGSSGGGFGTIMASYLVRYVYPGVPIYVLNDAGLGIARPGDEAFVDQLLDEFGAHDFIPDDCPDCVGGGHIIGLVRYLLERDDDLRVGAISSWYDAIISETFLGMPAEDFRDAVGAETTALQEDHPDRYRRFIFDGAAHTALLGDVSGIIGTSGDVELPDDFLSDPDALAQLEIESISTATAEGVGLFSWITAMVDDDLQGWADLTDPQGPPPGEDP